MMELGDRIQLRGLVKDLNSFRLQILSFPEAILSLLF